LRSEIANSIQQNFGLQLDSSDVEQVLLHEPTVLDEKVIEEISRMAEEWMVRIINRLHTYVPDFRINPTVFLGGGCQILHEQIQSSPDFKYIEFIDNIKANAVGYAMLVKAKLKRQ
jgi:plasmid segregation protein ParM